MKREDFEALDQEILDWYETIPEQIKIKSLGNNIPVPGTPTYNLGRLQIWTRLRLNQVSAGRTDVNPQKPGGVLT